MNSKQSIFNKFRLDVAIGGSPMALTNWGELDEESYEEILH